MPCRERLFLDTISKNVLVASNFASCGFKIDYETEELGPFVCSVAPSSSETNFTRFFHFPGSGFSDSGLGFFALMVGGATLQTNGPNSAVSESFLKPCGAKLDVTKPFSRLASRKQRSGHRKCPPQKVCSFFQYLSTFRYMVQKSSVLHADLTETLPNQQ